MDSEDNKEPGSSRPERSRKYAAFIAGAIFAFLLLGAGTYLNPSGATEFVGGRFQYILIALFIGISTGHYLGISIGNRFDINVAASLGAFITLSLSFLYISIPQGIDTSVLFSPGGLLVLSGVLLILGHYSHLIDENEGVEELIETFSQRISPAILGIIWLMEAVLPPIVGPMISGIGFEEIGATITVGIQLLVGVILLYAFVKIAEFISGGSTRR